MKRNITQIEITLRNVVRAGGVREAIESWCEESDSTTCGVVGSSFSTSGPGSGWSIKHGADDFSSRAFAEGACHYIDLDDGRAISAEPPTEPITEDAGGKQTDAEGRVVHTDIGGGDYVEGEWSEGSVICLECPSLDDAIDSPSETAEMAQAVIDRYGDSSDRDEWRALVEKIRAAAAALEDIDLSDL